MGMTVGLAVLFGFRRRLLGSAYFSLPRVQILIGVLALLVAAALVAKVFAGRFIRLHSAEPDVGGSAARETGRGRLATWAQRLLNGRSLWVAGMAGLGIASQSVDYLAALHDWIRSRRLVEIATLLAGVGCVLLSVGVAGL
jgi:hypothetical protein